MTRKFKHTAHLAWDGDQHVVLLMKGKRLMMEVTLEEWLTFPLVRHPDALPPPRAPREPLFRAMTSRP